MLIKQFSIKKYEYSLPRGACERYTCAVIKLKIIKKQLKLYDVIFLLNKRGFNMSTEQMMASLGSLLIDDEYKSVDKTKLFSDIKKGIEALKCSEEQKIFAAALSVWKRKLLKILEEARNDVPQLNIVNNHLQATADVIQAWGEYVKALRAEPQDKNKTTAQDLTDFINKFNDLKNKLVLFEKQVMAFSPREWFDLILTGIMLSGVALGLAIIIGAFAMNGFGLPLMLSIGILTLALAVFTEYCLGYMHLSRTLGIDAMTSSSEKCFFHTQLDKVNTFFFGPGITFRHDARFFIGGVSKEKEVLAEEEEGKEVASMREQLDELLRRDNNSFKM